MDQTLAILESLDNRVFGCRSAGPGVLESAVVRLVGAIYESQRGEAHRLLRNRIHTDAIELEIDRALVRVAAGKLTTGTTFEEAALDSICWLDDIANGLDARYAVKSELPAEGLCGNPAEIARQLDEGVRALPRNRERKRAEQDRPLAAALLNPDGAVLLAARNTAGLNKTRHAEVNLLALAQTKGLLPLQTGMQVVTTLSPCKMCAAMLVHAFEDGDAAQVTYLERDPGKLASGTALDRVLALQRQRDA